MPNSPPATVRGQQGSSSGREGATLANWRSQPFSSWAFQNVRVLLPVADIGRVPERTWELPVTPRSLHDFHLPFGRHVPMTLDDFLAETVTDALLVVHEGRIVHEYYAHGMTERTRHIVMSASKSIVGLLAGILHRDGGLDPETAVSELVPEIAGTAYRGATLRHLLDMRAGAVFDDEDLRAYATAGNWQPRTPDDPPADLHAFFENTPGTSIPHGGPFRYVSAHTDLLGWALERAAGQPFATVARERLWEPMGAAEEAYITLDGRGAPRCTGGLCSTARDLARIGQLLVQDGRRGERQIVPSKWIDDILQNGDADAWRKGEFAAGFPGVSMHYRSGWYVIDDEPQTLFALAIHGQHLFVDRRNRLVVAKLLSQASAIDQRAIALTQAAVAEIRRCLLGE